MFLRKRETAATGTSCQGQNSFPLAIHLGGLTPCGENVNISKHVPFHKVCGRGPLCERQGKSFTKPFNLTLAVVLLASYTYLLSHVERLEISKKVVPSPEFPLKGSP